MQAVERLEKLNKERPDPSFWCQNIIDAHALCKTERDYQVFQLFMTSPADKFDVSRLDEPGFQTIGQAIDNMTPEEQDRVIIHDYPPHMEEIITQNGNQIIIDVRHKSNSDDEKFCNT